MTKILLVIGNVSHGVYSPALRALRNQGYKPKVVRISVTNWVSGEEVSTDYETDSTAFTGVLDQKVKEALLALRGGMSQLQFEREFLQGGWLLWRYEVHPDDIAGIVYAEEDEPSGDDLESFQQCFEATWYTHVPRRPVPLWTVRGGVMIQDRF